MRRLLLRSAFLTWILTMFGVSLGAARAADVSDFYRGRTITIVSPDEPGSGFDQYARLVGMFIGKYIPGNPKVIIQNMPGAGGLVEANYLYNLAPRDGSQFAIIMHGNIFRPVLDPREVRFKVEGFRWLGSVAPIVAIGAFRKDAAAQTADELFTRGVMVGVSGGTTAYLPASVNNILDTKMKLIPGYRSTADIILAMKRQEVAGVVGIGLDSLQYELPGREADHYRILFQMGVKRAASLPDVPLIQEFAKSDLDRNALDTIFASFSIGRVFLTPKIPDDRYAALKVAFEHAVKDPDFVKQAKKQKSDVNYMSPNEIENIIKHVYSQPDPVLKRAAAAMMAN
jgi:tripartite-type tricarboxylate transporter receptor subunit TctC